MPSAFGLHWVTPGSLAGTQAILLLLPVLTDVRKVQL